MRKNRVKALLLAGVLMIGGAFAGLTSTAVFAAENPEEWIVTFNSSGKMENNYKSLDINDKISKMQPGDRTVFTVNLENAYPAATDWYMWNQILSTLEDSVNNAAGGGYTYTLTYTDPAGKKTTLFNSDPVGGDRAEGDRIGLREATGGMEDWSYLDTIASGGTGKVQLEVALDGETQGNDYQDSLAELKLDFGVVLPTPTPTPTPTVTPTPTPTGTPTPTPTGTPTPTPTVTLTPTPTTVPSGGSGGYSWKGDIVKTGDSSKPGLYLGLMGIAGAILLVLAIFGIKSRKRQEETTIKTTDTRKGGHKK